MLVGAGTIPPVSGQGATEWTTPLGPQVGLLDDQLITNAAGYASSGEGYGGGWRGAYLESAVRADPWGQRYAVNVKAMRILGADIIVLSAGPDGIVESQFEVDGLPTGGDDIVSLVFSTGVSP